jgi:hypothetical protein
MSAAPRRFRGIGRGRKVRRTLRQGGTGASARLNEAVGRWDGVRITPMFGRWGYFSGEQLFACFPLREKEHDLWIRLSPSDQARALREPGLRPHRRFASRGWICAGCAARITTPSVNRDGHGRQLFCEPDLTIDGHGPSGMRRDDRWLTC